MAITIKDLSTVKSEMASDLSVNLPQASQGANSAITQLFINAPALQLSQLYDSLKQVSDSTQLVTLTGNLLDAYASNYNLTRKNGTAATGYVYLVLDESFDSGKDITITNGSLVTASTSTKNVLFSVQGDQILRASDREIYAATAKTYAPQLAVAGIFDVKYLASVPIQSTVLGTDGVVGAYAIVVGNLPNVKQVVNFTPTQGGYDVESDASLKERISLVISGNSVGTVDGIRKATLSTSGISSAFVVGPGDPLMSRDGTVRDTSGNVIQVGKGNALDVYVLGEQGLGVVEDYLYTETSSTENIDLTNAIVLGTASTISSTDPKLQPVVGVSSVVGSQSGANFILATEQADEDGNIILVGNVALIKDFLADNYTLVRNNVTRQLAIARSLSPSSSKYSIVESLVSSPNSNSVNGEDKLIFLDNKATVNRETITRGSQLNGADALQFSNVTDLQLIQEDVQVEREIVQVVDSNSFQVNTRHTPVMSVSRVYHVRLGTQFTAEIIDGTTGTLKLAGRFAPQSGDLIEISYVWRKTYLNNFEYSLFADSVQWIDENRTIENNSLMILDAKLQDTQAVQFQPLTPTYLAATLSNVAPRATYEVTVLGDTSNILEGVSGVYQSGVTPTTDAMVFGVPASVNIDATASLLGQVTTVRNVTQGYNYNLLGYALSDNRYAPEADVIQSLTANQFSLSKKANALTIEVGDSVRFGAPNTFGYWSSTEDLANNIKGNPIPVFDATKLVATNGELDLLQPEQNGNLPVTVAPTRIDVDTTWTGLVRVDTDFVVGRDATLTIESGTVIAVVSSSNLPNVSEIQQRARLQRQSSTPNSVPVIPSGTTSLYYVFLNDITTVPYFVILNDDQNAELLINYSSDVIVKIVNPLILGGYDYYINTKIVDAGFVHNLSNALAASAYLIATKHNEVILSVATDIYTLFDIVRGGSRVYLLPLESSPRQLETGVYDILIKDCCSTNDIHSAIYDPSQGQYAVLSYILSDNHDWIAEYGVTVINRATIRVEGRIVAEAETMASPIIFTSFSPVNLPGDWGGIHFNLTSHSLQNLSGKPSVLRNCIIKYADIPIENTSSDPILERVICKNYLSAGGVSTNSIQVLNEYRTSDYIASTDIFAQAGRYRTRVAGNEGLPTSIETVNTTTPNGSDPCVAPPGTGCSAAPVIVTGSVSTLAVAFPLQLKPVKPTGDMPTFHFISDDRLVADLGIGSTSGLKLFIERTTDVYVDTATLAVESFTSGKKIYLTAGIDYGIELNLVTKIPEIILYNTQTMIGFLNYYVGTGVKKKFSISYDCCASNGSVTDCVFTNATTPGWIVSGPCDITFTNNTFYKTGNAALVIEHGYSTIHNNICNEYTTIPIVKLPQALTFATNNDTYSKLTQDSELYRPVNIDTVTSPIYIDDIVIPVQEISKYTSGMILKIDDEAMTVEQVGVQVRVKRAQYQTVAAPHNEGARILIIREKTFFTITGIPYDNCVLVQTDSTGIALGSTLPATMVEVDRGSFKVAIPIDRKNTVFYRYEFTNSAKEVTQTSLRELPTDQFGNGVNDIYSPFEEPATIIRSSNYSANPLFINPTAENFELETNSPANKNNPIYNSISNPSVVYNRYLGTIANVQAMVLIEGTKTITLTNPMIVVGTITDSIAIRNTVTGKLLLPGSYNAVTKIITLATPVSLRNAGEYSVEYNSPSSLGSSIEGNPMTGLITYQFDAKRPVRFIKFKASVAGEGGIIQFAYKTATRKDLLASQNYSNNYTLPASGEIDLLAIEDPNKPGRGAIIEFKVTILGNDGSFSAAGTYQYPRLLDFTLVYAPELDTQEYTIKSVAYLSKFDNTEILLELPDQPGVGITVDTGTALSGITSPSLWIRKKNTTISYELAKLKQLNVGDTQLDLIGNFTTVKNTPALDDVIHVDYGYVSQGVSEVLTYPNSSTQITTNRFVGVTSIDALRIVDRLKEALDNESIRVDITNQPIPGSGYNCSYQFEAPKNGETIRVGFTYNSLIGSAQGNVDANKDALANILVREMFGINVTIKAHIVLLNGYVAQAVISNITRNISLYLDQFIQNNPLGGGRIDAMDTAALIKDTEGVDDLVMIAHYREGYTGVTNIVLTTREFPVLDATSPELTVVSASDPNQLLSTVSN